MNPVQALKDYLESRKYGGEGHTLLSLDDRLKAVTRIPFPAGSGGLGYGGWGNYFNTSQSGFRTPSDRINFALEAGDLRLSSLIVAAVRWVGRNLNSARLKVVTVDEEGKENEIQGHDIAKLWHRPNKLYSGSTLNTGIAASWIMDSTAYVIKVRGRMRGPSVELWWEPHYSIRPRWPVGNPMEAISYYEVYRNGAWWRVEPEDVIVFRDGYDPDTRKGWNSIAGLLSEIYTDKQLAALTGMLVKNGLVPAIAIGLGTDKSPFKGDVREFHAAVMRKMSAAEPLTVGGPVKIEKMGYDMSDYGIKEMRETPEQRFCAGIGISPISLMLGAGIDVSTYSNVEQYLRHDYRNYIVNLHDQIADQLEVDMLPDYGEAEGKIQIRWDYSKAPLMQPDKQVEWKLYFDGFEKRVFNRAQALEGCGMKFEEADKEIYYPVQAGMVTLSPLDEMPEPAQPFGADPFAGDPNQSDVTPEDLAGGKKPKPKKPPVEPTKARRVPISDKDADEGAQWWKTNAPPEARDLINATVKPNGKAN